ncbi:MAG: type I-B CRISPR-associated protein Cas8b1/Cst1 [Candidatus Thorarchaeota archaeon]|nr:type I-B CRISPR-associated protein Cas8b1/Cst1 [Candidatus Thorarchaeota archaeon]
MSKTKRTGQTTVAARPLFSLTGNPFVDNGLAALCVMAGKQRPEELDIEDVRTQAQYIVNVYSQPAVKKIIHGMFFPNSELVNPVVKDGMTKYQTLMTDLIERLSAPQSRGSCVACGLRDGDPVGKTRVPLLGSKKLVNFFPSGVEGERFCPNCIVAVQFLLLAVEKAGWPLMLHTSNWTIQYAYVKGAVNRFKRQAASKEYGLADRGYKQSAGLNAVYETIREILDDPDVQAMSDSAELVAPLRFYHFTNYGQGPDVRFYDIPSSVVDFLLQIRTRMDTWLRIVRRGYSSKKKGDPEELEYTTENDVYRQITDGKSIVKYFFEQEDYKVIGDWQLVSVYLARLRMMDDKRINTVRDVADRILAFSKKTGSARRIQQMHWARTYREFRSVLLKLQEEMVRKSGEPLVSYDEYVLDLAPEGGQEWQETRDLLLFRIYEMGCDWLASQPEAAEGADSEQQTMEVTE